jgi:hypothetical protein
VTYQCFSSLDLTASFVAPLLTRVAKWHIFGTTAIPRTTFPQTTFPQTTFPWNPPKRRFPEWCFPKQHFPQQCVLRVLTKIRVVQGNVIWGTIVLGIFGKCRSGKHRSGNRHSTIFSYPNPQFWYILEGLGKKIFDIFYNHLVYFWHIALFFSTLIYVVVIWYIFPIFGLCTVSRIIWQPCFTLEPTPRLLNLYVTMYSAGVIVG